MRLAEFIRTNREAILAEWEGFARTCSPASSTMDVTALRDHASAMLSAFADDLESPQDGIEQAAKSRGERSEDGRGGITAATRHGSGRADSGFDIEQMVAEYRALRASVLRLWTQSEGRLGPDHVNDLIRFNEAVDQALAESVAAFDESVEQSKEIFIAMLGHDLRTPLGAIMSSALFLLESGELNETHRSLAARMADAARRTTHMVGDLLDFTRSRLGGGIPILRERTDLAALIREVVDEVATFRTDAVFEISVPGEMHGEWDVARLRQALTNLITNAVQHGQRGEPITLHADGDRERVTIAVHNAGEAIPSELLDGLFNPMKERSGSTRRSSPRGPTDSLGLGLYIAERIVSAHEGHIEVVSTPDAGTTFTVHLPRQDSALATQ